jgi:hypothetical protein
MLATLATDFNTTALSGRHPMKRTTLAFITLLAALPANAASVTFGDSKNGATISGDFTSQLSGTNYTAGVTGGAQAQVFGKAIPLAAGNADLTVTKGTSRSRVKGNLKALGTTIANFDRTVSNNASFRTENFYAAEAGGRMTFGLGPFTLKLEGKAELQTYADGNLDVAWRVGGPPILKARIGPALDAAAYGKFEADAIIASASIEGSLKLTGYGVYANLELMPRTGSGQNQADVRWTATFDRLATDGKIKIKAKALAGAVSYSKTIFSYEGGPSSIVLASGTRRIN